MTQLELQDLTGLSMSKLHNLIRSVGLEVKDLYTEEEASQIAEAAKGSKLRKTRQSDSSGSGNIVVSAQKRTAIGKRVSMEQAVQDGQEANRVYAETYLTVLDHGMGEFTESLTQHLGSLRESLLETEDDADFLSQLLANGCGGSLPKR